MKCSLDTRNFLVLSFPRSLVFPILLLSSISLHWSLKKAFLSLLAILWNSTFRWVYLSHSLHLYLLFFSQLFVRPLRQPLWLLAFIFLGSWCRVLTKCGPLEKGMANHFSIPALRTPWTIWKDKKIGHWKMNYPGQSIGAEYATGGQWRNKSRKNEGMEPKQNNTTPSCGCDWWWKQGLML